MYSAKTRRSHNAPPEETEIATFLAVHGPSAASQCYACGSRILPNQKWYCIRDTKRVICEACAQSIVRQGLGEIQANRVVEPAPPEKTEPIVRDAAGRCFRCDGTGELCNSCGESAYICECDVEVFYPCPDCQKAIVTPGGAEVIA